MATRYCGLDFGTSNSTLALNADGRSFLCPLEGDSVLLPSAVFYDAEDHSVRFGRDAIRNSWPNPAQCPHTAPAQVMVL